MINASLPKTYELDKKYENLHLIRDELINQTEQIKVEIWKYDPLLFSNNHKSIDILSLILLFIKNDDERIKQAIDELVKPMLEESIS